MLKKLTLHSFKAFQEAEVQLGAFTILVGPNGAGKSTVLQAIDLLGGLVRSTITGFLESHTWEYADLPHLRSTSSRFGVDATFEFDGEEVVWELELGTRRYPGVARERIYVREPANGKSDPRERVVLQRDGRSMWRLDESLEGSMHQREAITQSLPSSWLAAIEPREDQARFPTLARVAAWARGVRGYFFLDPVRLRAPNRGTPDDIGRHGELLAPFLAHLQKTNRDAFTRVVDRVQRHYRPLEELHFKRTGYGWTSIEVTERWGKERARFNARQVSDGLLRLIAVAAMRELPSPPTVLLVDEVENGLHPHLMEGFIGMLHELANERGGRTQVLVTTHSPIAVNFAASAREVLMVTRNRRGGVQVVPLAEARGFPELAEHFDLGELWYNAGEKRLVR
jgi:predicted ATPase